jgi:hypothetical protein
MAEIGILAPESMDCQVEEVPEWVIALKFKNSRHQASHHEGTPLLFYACNSIAIMASLTSVLPSACNESISS